MSTIQVPVTQVEQCPLYQLLVAERQAVDSAIGRLARGDAPQYEPLDARSRVAGMVQHSICRQRTLGEQPRERALSHIEDAIGHLPTHEQPAVLEALTACQAGCLLSG